jgi:DNA-binding Xre family transcriptional regulator
MLMQPRARSIASTTNTRLDSRRTAFIVGSRWLNNGKPDSLPVVAFAAVEPDELRARIALRIRELAKRRKLTLSQLAVDSGVSPAHLWAVLGGEHSPSSDILCKLARVLQVDPDELVRRPRKPKTAT